MNKFHTFGLGEINTETSANILGGKGAGLVQMTALGISVPPGFIIPTTTWERYIAAPKTTMKEISKELPEHLSALQKHFGYMPLLSVRSGSRISCPGMMDTLLNVGLDNSTKIEWLDRLGAICANGCLQQLITMYGSVVKGVSREELETGLVSTALDAYELHTGESFPSAKDQLLASIEAVFKSWDNERAKVYRKLHSIPREWGTAVIVQAMVFGNMNSHSGTGVLFTRNPDTGEAKVTGEFLINAQGEDVVAGIRTPVKLSEMAEWNSSVYCELHETVAMLEKHFQDMQDIEFTIQDGKLYLLQTRNGKRSAAAAVKIVVDMVAEGLIAKSQALQRVTPRQLDLAQIPVLDASFTKAPAFTGIAACSGIVTGVPVFTAKAAVESKVPCILITKETTPDDIAGMLASVGVVTMEGGLTSHAAVVARGENKPCITGVGAHTADFKKAKVVSMDGATGRIWLEEVPVVSGGANENVAFFKEMLLDHTGAIPVIFEVPENEIPVAVLSIGVNLIDPVKTAGLIANCAVRVSKLYVDLLVNDEAEGQFFQLFTSQGLIHDVLEEMATLLSTFSEGGKEEFKKRVVFVTLGNVPQTLRKCEVVDGLESLILANEEMIVSPEFYSSMQTSPAISWVLNHKEVETTPIILGQFAINCKSAMSEMALLIEVQKCL